MEQSDFSIIIVLVLSIFPNIAKFRINHTGGGGGITIGEADFLLRLLLVLEIVFCCSFSILSLGETECRIFDLRSLSVFWSALNAREKGFKVILLTLGCNYKIFLWFSILNSISKNNTYGNRGARKKYIQDGPNSRNKDWKCDTRFCQENVRKPSVVFSIPIP